MCIKIIEWESWVNNQRKNRYIHIIFDIWKYWMGNNFLIPPWLYSGLLLSHHVYIPSYWYPIMTIFRVTIISPCLYSKLLVSHHDYIQGYHYLFTSVFQVAGIPPWLYSGLLLSHHIYITSCWYLTITIFRVAIFKYVYIPSCNSPTKLSCLGL